MIRETGQKLLDNSLPNVNNTASCQICVLCVSIVCSDRGATIKLPGRRGLIILAWIEISESSERRTGGKGRRRRKREPKEEKEEEEKEEEEEEEEEEE